MGATPEQGLRSGPINQISVLAFLMPAQEAQNINTMQGRSIDFMGSRYVEMMKKETISYSSGKESDGASVSRTYGNCNSPPQVEESAADDQKEHLWLHRTAILATHRKQGAGDLSQGTIFNRIHQRFKQVFVSDGFFLQLF